MIGGGIEAGAQTARPTAPTLAPPRFTRNTALSVTEKPNTLEEITTYNNFYEFGLDKTDPMENSREFRSRPWTVEIAGECGDAAASSRSRTSLSRHALEERVYRFRCVEAWSRVVPWLGSPARRPADALQAHLTCEVRRVHHPARPARQMPGQRTGVLDWPYREGLRMDEAMHPLALLAVGVYGKWLPNQNGAPLRLVVPWKYGFKGIKSIVRHPLHRAPARHQLEHVRPRRVRFLCKREPGGRSSRAGARRKERRIGGSFLASRIDTLPFNGYADQVATLYRGMDLRRFY
jgi:sulfoxide reductase catalytic subunit YedY